MAEPVVDPVVELPLDELLGLVELLGLDALAVSLELPADTFVRMNCWLLLEALPLPDVPVAPIDPDASAGFTQPVSVIDFESLDSYELLELDGVWLEVDGVWLDVPACPLAVDCAARGAVASTADARIPITN